MQRTGHNERVKSINLINHLVPEKRKIKPIPSSSRPTVSEDSNQTNKMVNETKKIETGLLVDVCSGNAKEEFYDSPLPGSPRAVNSKASNPSPPLQDDIGVGSLVEVATDVDQNYYGVVRWIGLIDDIPTAGVELEQSVCGLGDGVHRGARVFSCSSGRALFVPLPLCRRDARFRDTPPPETQRTDLGDQPECPVVPGVVPPLSSLGDLAGKNRGIQGHHNSCYLDATLFAMFTFTSVFDALLYRPPEPEDSPHYSEVQRVLREEIVNPLRKHGYVRADRVMKLRTLLERLSDVPGLTSEEKDPEEFLNGLVAQLLRAEPFLKLSSGQEAFCYQLFVEKDEHITLPSVQQLLEQSFATSGVKLSEVPAAFIIQMPRFGKQYKLYQRVQPSPLLDVTDLIEGLPRQCGVCGSLARWECGACAGGALDAGALCAACLRLAHSTRPHHKATPLTVSEEYANILESCPVPRVYMELFAVLCIETSHYVAFVKTGVGHDVPWCFFDSMADRKGERNGYNIPEIVSISSLGAWLSEEGRALHRAAPLDRHLPAPAKRLLADAYMCFYRSPDVAMYRVDLVLTRGSHYKPPRYRPPHWYMPKERVMSEDLLTQENRDFIEEFKQDKYNLQAALESPLDNIKQQEKFEWDPFTKRVGLIARKIGNYPLWTKDGKKVQTTLLQVVDNHVIKYIPPEEYTPMKQWKVKWMDKRNMGCLLVGSETIDPSTVTKDYCGLFSRVGMLPKRHLCRFSVSPQAKLETGTPLFATHFRVGDYLDIRAKTIDRGFQGVMKRWGFKGMPASHGVTKTHRRPGNIGSGGQKARVWPGTKLPGHMGNRWRILRGVKILRINTKHNVLWTLGVAIPGETGAMCYLYDTILPLKKLQTPPPFPTHPAVDDLPLEYYDESVHLFEEPSLSFEEA